MIKSVGVFCGSSSGFGKLYSEVAASLGRFLATNNIRLVYGGASVGLMGIMADAALAEGGEVVGVIPDFFSRKEIAHNGLSKLIFAQSMHERKLKIVELSDAFIAMPGGFGTLDELFEVITWGQLDLHRKPAGILNIAGYYNHLITFLGHMQDNGFLKKAHREMLIVDDSIESLIQRLNHYEAPEQAKWINRIKTK